MKRRAFLNNLVVSSLGGFALTRTSSLFAFPVNKRLSRIGLQLYTVRNPLEKDFEGTLAKVASLGYTEVEFAGYFNHKPAEVKAILNRYNLSSPSAHISTSVLRGNLQEAIDAAHMVGHQYIVCAYLPAEERRTMDDYKRLIDRFNSAGEQFRKAGIQFAYHNHDFEFQRMDEKLPYDVILAETDPVTVKMEIDLYWITKAGQNPLEYFRRYPGRFPLAHIKDMDATPKRFFTEVGQGTIDFKKILSSAGTAGFKHYFVEQDETPGSPFSSIKISFDYLKQLQF